MPQSKGKQLDEIHFYRTLDRIENLKISCKLYQKSKPPILLEELETHWLQLVVKGSNYEESIPSLTALDGGAAATQSTASPTSPETKSPSSKKLSKIKKPIQKQRKLYTVINQDMENSSGLTGSLQNLNLNVDGGELVNSNLKSSRGLQRALVPSPHLLRSDGLFASLFRPEQDSIGIPGGSSATLSQRWNASTNGGSISSDMEIKAVLPVSVQKGGIALDFVEKTLFKIEYFGNGNYSVTPNFSSTDEERYEFTVGDDAYEYTIENSSIDLSKENEKKEKMIFEEFFKRQQIIRLEKVSVDAFDVVPDAFSTRYAINGEILTAKGFHSDILYIQYLVHIPADWSPDVYQENLLTAYTQMAHCTVVGDNLDRTAFFGCPVEINLLCGGEIPTMPSIYLKVVSTDSEDRHFLEGYGHVMIPSRPGSHTIEVNTWRPLNNFATQLQSWFLGGTPDLADLKFNELAEIKGPLNRYGFQTESSGSVKMRFNTIVQNDSPLTLEATKSSRPTLIDETNDALERAKIRLATLKSLAVDNENLSPTA